MTAIPSLQILSTLDNREVRMGIRHGSWTLVVALAAGGGVLATAGDPPSGTAAFFEAYERGDAKAALAALPADVRDASPYDATTAALAPEQRDAKVYAALVARMEKEEAVSETSRAEAVVAFDLGLLALREGDAPRAMQKLLLSVARDPFDRMTHVYLARIGRVTASEHADEHLEMAREVAEARFPKPCPVVRVAFVFAQGAIEGLTLSAGEATASQLDPRDAVATPAARDHRVALLAADHGLLDERWFPPVETMFVDGVDEHGERRPGRIDRTTFEVSLDLLAPRPGAHVAIYDAAGKRLIERAVPVAKAK